MAGTQIPSRRVEAFIVLINGLNWIRVGGWRHEQFGYASKVDVDTSTSPVWFRHRLAVMGWLYQISSQLFGSLLSASLSRSLSRWRYYSFDRLELEALRVAFRYYVGATLTLTIARHSTPQLMVMVTLRRQCLVGQTLIALPNSANGNETAPGKLIGRLLPRTLLEELCIALNNMSFATTETNKPLYCALKNHLCFCEMCRR